MDIREFKAAYTTATANEKDKKIITDDCYTLAEAVYSLVKAIEELRSKLNG
jgi:hypothetical protein